MDLPQLAAVWWLCLTNVHQVATFIQDYQVAPVVAVSDPVDLMISQLKVPVTISSALFCLLVLKVAYPMLSLMLFCLLLF